MDVSRTLKKAECQRIDAFELWCWRRFLKVPWTARWSNQSILKEINPENSLEGLMLKLKLEYFSHLMRRTNSLEDSDAGKDWRQEEKGTTEDEMAGWHQTQWTWVWVSSGSWWWTGNTGVLQSMQSQRVGHNWATEQQQTAARNILNTTLCLLHPIQFCSQVSVDNKFFHKMFIYQLYLCDCPKAIYSFITN